jgi:hypothetical protein
MLLSTAILMLCSSIIAAGSFFLGVTYDRLKRDIIKINEDLEIRKKEERDESAIIETTPQIIREKTRKGQELDEDSAIVTTKSPQEIRKAKDTQLQRELDKLGR